MSSGDKPEQQHQEPSEETVALTPDPDGDSPRGTRLRVRSGEEEFDGSNDLSSCHPPSPAREGAGGEIDFPIADELELLEDVSGDDLDVLEEMVLPGSVETLEPLEPDTVIGPDGSVRIEELIAARGRANRYRATWQQEPDNPVEVELREGSTDLAGLQREAEVLGEVQYAMLPKRVATFEENGRRYLAIEWRERGSTLADALANGLSAEQAAAIVIQLAQALRRLHQAGWALPGLAPADVQLGQPVRLTNLTTAVRIGEEPGSSLSIPGYSAPEAAYGGAVSGKEDVYTLAAILYHALTGAPVPEPGLAAFSSTDHMRTPGAPQLLEPALATPDERPDLEAFYQQLLAFRRRLARATIGLQIASGTTIGLNPTRTVNEDACGFTKWTVADELGARERAVLCMVDGMGGMEAGEVASQAALRAVMTSATSGTTSEVLFPSGDPPPIGTGAPSPPVDQAVRLNPVHLVQRAAAEVFEAAAGRSVGATITCAVVEDGVLALAHVGDTRAYLLRDGTLRQLTVDHSLVAAMVASGVLTKEEARHHPESNKVLRALGTHATLREEYVDTLAAALGEPTLHLRAGDQLLLCSDGVWGTVDDDRLLVVLMEAIDPPTAVQVILRDALAAGALDNASVIVARCTPMPGN